MLASHVIKFSIGLRGRLRASIKCAGDRQATQLAHKLFARAAGPTVILEGEAPLLRLAALVLRKSDPGVAQALQAVILQRKGRGRERSQSDREAQSGALADFAVVARECGYRVGCTVAAAKSLK